MNRSRRICAHWLLPLPFAGALVAQFADPASPRPESIGSELIARYRGQPVASVSVAFWQDSADRRWDGWTDANGRVSLPTRGGTVWLRTGTLAAIASLAPASPSDRVIELQPANALRVAAGGRFAGIRTNRSPARTGSALLVPRGGESILLPPGRYTALLEADPSGALGERDFEVAPSPDPNRGPPTITLAAPKLAPENVLRVPADVEPELVLTDWPGVKLPSTQDRGALQFRLPDLSDRPQRILIRARFGPATAELRRWRWPTARPEPVRLTRADFGSIRKLRVRNANGPVDATNARRVRSQSAGARPDLRLRSGVDEQGFARVLADPDATIRIDWPGHAWQTQSTDEVDWERGLTLQPGRTLILALHPLGPLPNPRDPIRVGIRLPGTPATESEHLRVGQVIAYPSTGNELRFEHCPTEPLEVFVTGSVAGIDGLVPSGTTNERIELEFDPGQTLRGVVLRADGQPARAAFVTVRDTSRTGSARTVATSPDGSFVVQGLDPEALLTVRAEWRDGPRTYAARIRGIQAGTDCVLRLVNEDPSLPLPSGRDR